MPDVVLVTDMVRGFTEPGHPLYVGDAVRQIIPPIRRLLAMERRRGSRLLFICDNHAEDDLEFRMFPPHCIRGTAEAEIDGDLIEFADEKIPKNRYSGFYGTGLAARLEELSPEKITVVGNCTNICVLYTVADARFRDYEVEVPVNAVASFDVAAHDFALSQMEHVLGARMTRVISDS